LINDLLDLKEVFSRIDSTKLSVLLTPKLYEEIDKILKKEGEEWWMRGWEGIRILAEEGEFCHDIIVVWSAAAQCSAVHLAAVQCSAVLYCVIQHCTK
jgi:hypothetical protein